METVINIITTMVQILTMILGFIFSLIGLSTIVCFILYGFKKIKKIF